MDIQRVKHCGLCSLRFGLSEKRHEFQGKVVHKEPCLRRLKAAEQCRLERLKEKRHEADGMYPL